MKQLLLAITASTLILSSAARAEAGRTAGELGFACAAGAATGAVMSIAVARGAPFAGAYRNNPAHLKTGALVGCAAASAWVALAESAQSEEGVTAEAELEGEDSAE